MSSATGKKEPEQPATANVEPSQTVKNFFICIGIGLNVASAIYFTHVGVFAKRLGRSIFGEMIISYLSAGICALLAQSCADHYFDNAYGSKPAYTCRFASGLFVQGVCLLIIPFTVHRTTVIVIGVLIGFFGGASLTSVQQVASSTHAASTKLVSTGITSARAVPIVLSLCLSFDSDATMTTKMMFCWIPGVLCFVLFVAVLFFAPSEQALHATFVRMDQTIRERAVSEADTPPLSSMSRLTGDGDSVWRYPLVVLSSTVQFLGNGLTMFLMPFVTYFGSFDLAQTLILVCFAGELLGRYGALYVRLWDFGMLNSKGLALLVCTVAVRTGLLVVFMLRVYDVIHFSNAVLGIFMFVFYLVYAWGHSELMVVVTKFCTADQRPEVMRGMMFLMFAAQLTSAVIGMCTVDETLEH